MKYDFKCDGKCQKIMEFDLPMTAEKPTTCPICGGKLSRVWTVPYAIYVGDGFTLGNKGRNDAGEPLVERKQ